MFSTMCCMQHGTENQHNVRKSRVSGGQARSNQMARGHSPRTTQKPPLRPRVQHCSCAHVCQHLYPIGGFIAKANLDAIGICRHRPDPPPAGSTRAGRDASTAAQRRVTQEAEDWPSTGSASENLKHGLVHLSSLVGTPACGWAATHEIITTLPTWRRPQCRPCSHSSGP